MKYRLPRWQRALWTGGASQQTPKELRRPPQMSFTSSAAWGMALVGQDGAYVAADKSKPGEERALEGRLAEKVTEQLHGILDRMFQFDSADAYWIDRKRPAAKGRHGAGS
eukprot:jgi/Tetstr1/443770/TSEL_031758.t1